MRWVTRISAHLHFTEAHFLGRLLCRSGTSVLGTFESRASFGRRAAMTVVYDGEPCAPNCYNWIWYSLGVHWFNTDVFKLLLITFECGNVLSSFVF